MRPAFPLLAQPERAVFTHWGDKIMSHEMQCSFCGATVSNGFVVCKACGAHYKAQGGIKKAFGYLFMFSAFAIWFVVGDTNKLHHAPPLSFLIFYSLTMFCVGVYLLKLASKKFWFR
jgi:hypothetical protein